MALARPATPPLSPLHTTRMAHGAFLGGNTPDDAIFASAEDWEYLVSKKLKEYQGIGKLLTQKFHIECESELFWSHIAECDLRSCKFEFVHGSAEITVYSASIIHNAIGELNWQQ